MQIVLLAQLRVIKVGTFPLNMGLRWLRCCATNRKVTGSIPAGVIGIFH